MAAAMFFSTLAIVLALLLQAGAAPQRPVEQTLDVLGIPPPTPEMEQALLKQERHCGCASASTHEPPRISLKVTLVYVTPETFAVGDTVVFELLIDHTGTEPVPLAISRDVSLAPSCRNADGDVRTSFSLFAKGSHELIAIGPALFGERGSAATTMMLNPGERLRVRVPATITGMERTRTPIDESQTLDVDGAILTSWDRCRSILQRSQGTIPVVVSRPKSR